MGKSTHFVIFGDQTWPVNSLVKTLPLKSPVSVFIEGEGWSERSNGSGTRSTLKGSRFPLCGKRGGASPKTALKAMELFAAHPECFKKSQVIAIVGLDDVATRTKLLEKLKKSELPLKVLELVSKHKNKSDFRAGKRKVFWGDLFSHSIEHEMMLLKLQDRVKELRDALKDSDRIAILLQDDPDPDGLAAALALRKLLGRKAQTASICSFGAITRPENLAMAKLLEIEVEKVDLLILTKNYDKVVLVDCQPAFFRGRPIPAHVVIDHHPSTLTAAELEVLDFAEVREDLGSTSTLMTMYMQAVDVEVSQRLATALFYGIKTDTFMLNREVSGLDLEAFVFLYPLVNIPTLRRIERPELPLAYLRSLTKALDFITEKNELSVLSMGEVRNEEWIPQSADFALQIEGTKLAIGCGIFESKVVLSARTCGLPHHVGDLFQELFDHLGTAGGHRSMAKAIVPLARWIKEFGGVELDQASLYKTIQKMFSAAIA